MRRLRRRWTEHFWALPLLCVVVALGLGLGLTALDQALGTSFTMSFLFSGGPEGARSLLSAIITSMIAFTGLVFSITIVVLQLTSSQFSPRVLRTFTRDRFNQLALGVFVATFVYGLVVLRGVRGTAQVEPFVPQIATTVSFLFVLASVVMFLLYIHHIIQSIRAATIVTRIGEEARARLEDRYPADAAEEPAAPPLPPADRRVAAQRPGVVQRVDDGALLRLAEESGVSIRLLRAVGEFVPAGAPLFALSAASGLDEAALHRAVALGSERSPEEDVGFGLRQLVDIAERALSPGVNDPTTAVQALDIVHDLVRRLATRRLGRRRTTSCDGSVVVDVPEPEFEDYLTLACEEVARSAEDSPRVRRRLDVMLRDLETAARPEHRPAVRRALLTYGTRCPDDDLDPPRSDTGLR